MAKRTFEESGHYYVKEFITSVKDNINDQIGNRGVYLPGQVTAVDRIPQMILVSLRFLLELLMSLNTEFRFLEPLLLTSINQEPQRI